jgi:hypothetical protein
MAGSFLAPIVLVQGKRKKEKGKIIIANRQPDNPVLRFSFFLFPFAFPQTGG